jgi:hypothetical protein
MRLSGPVHDAGAARDPRSMVHHVPGRTGHLGQGTGDDPVVPRQLPVTHDVTETGVFVTSELVANAVKAMQVKTVNGPYVEVSWRMFAERLLIEVT